MTSRGQHATRRIAAAAAAAPFGGVLSRRELRQLGCEASFVAAQVTAQRWRLHGRQTVAIHTGRLDELALRWRAIWEVGHRIAVLDGVSALHAAGLTGFVDPRVHVSVPFTAKTHPITGVFVHKVRHRDPADLLQGGLPRVKPAAAAIRAAHWATSDRQAALLMVLPVQQRLTTGARLVLAADRVRGRTRRAFIAGVAADLADGVHSLGELDFARSCRRYGLPAPTRQELRQLPNGRAYLDVFWRGYELAAEIDGAGHRMGLSVTSDNLRMNEVTLGEQRVLRIDTIGLRLHEARFMDQIARGLRLRAPAPPERRTAS